MHWAISDNSFSDSGSSSPAGDPELRTQLSKLRYLLENRGHTVPILSPGLDSPDYLPDFPAVDCAHWYHDKFHFIDAPSFSAIAYLTDFANGNTTFDSEMCFMVQGISKDGKYYISAEVPIRCTGVPNQNSGESDSDFDDRLGRVVDKCDASSFKPSIKIVDKWLGTFKLIPF